MFHDIFTFDILYFSKTNFIWIDVIEKTLSKIKFCFLDNLQNTIQQNKKFHEPLVKIITNKSGMVLRTFECLPQMLPNFLQQK